MAAGWETGEVIVRREVLGLAPGFHPDPPPPWYGRPWEALPVYVVRDDAEHLVTYIAEGAEMGFVDGPWPTPDGLHPWSRKQAWGGHGCLMVQRPGDPWAVWHFWKGPDREFACWYVNLQADFVRTSIGYDTQDFELDLIVYPDGSLVVKDLEVLDDRVAEGRYTAGLVDWIRSLGDDLVGRLEVGERLWDDRWSRWEPPSSWRGPRLPEGWATVD
ncbi:MAG TPA: DUF402 domain-containing protein [Acidimicrobiales bacterium]|nr:DUF402 domain-containing protein [Acidimicrobiales bacterium]